MAGFKESAGIRPITAVIAKETMACLICSIIDGRIPVKIIYEDSDTVAFLDAHPAAPGHTMLVPRVHAARV